MYRRLLIFTFTLITLIILIGILPVHGEEAVYDSVLRLHVLANSDSEEDQALKLRVRDRILSDSAHLFENCSSREDAKAVVEENLSLLCDIATDEVREAGYSYSVSVELSEEQYPRKDYESFCFPSGNYLSLKIKIGEAEGQNWWCVLFPPLCLSAASKSAEDQFISVGLTDGEYKIITENENPKYKVRFKILETIENALN